MARKKSTTTKKSTKGASKKAEKEVKKKRGRPRKVEVEEEILEEEHSPLFRIEEHVLQAVLAVLFFFLGAFFMFAWNGSAGPAGQSTFQALTGLFGYGYFLAPLSMFVLALAFWKSTKMNFAVSNLTGITLFLISGLGLMDVFTGGNGGSVGGLIAEPLLNLFEIYVTVILLVGIMLISLVVLFDIKLSNLSLDMFRRGYEEDDEEDEDYLLEEEDYEDEASPVINKLMEEEKALAETRAEEAGKKQEREKKPILSLGKKEVKDSDGELDAKLGKDASRLGLPFTPPPLNLLEKDSGKPSVGDVKANRITIERTLRNFGVNVVMDDVAVGPTVTRYALKPAEGVKLSRIESLQKEIQAALSAQTIRIEAPIPGTNLVGIEVPNVSKSTVGLATLLASPKFSQSDKALLVTLGKGLSGAPEFADLAKMPHLLVAGTTGAGKSVTVHMLIASLLYRNPPESLKFIMVDPKRVELTLYNDIPHLLTPVIKNAKKAILALKWAAKEMERRYDILEENRVQNIDSYHKNILTPAVKKMQKMVEKNGGEEVDYELPEAMPYIVIIIDELADIMSAYPKELEAAIVRLAQMSRAVGIHLILSTQRPDVRVITGLIKANVPSRLALQVSSQIDSRTILDKAGAEKLLGKGDMLYQGGDMSKPARIQSGFVTEKELKNLTTWLIDHYSEKLQDTIDFDSETRENNTESIFNSISVDDSEDDDKYEEARETVVQAGKASTSFLQRKLGVGYSRAAKLIDMLEERGVIGPQNGSKPREVLGGESGSDSSDESESNLYEPEDNESKLNREEF